MKKRRKGLILSYVFIIIIAIGIIFPCVGESAYWASLPPYNLLWPLWSNILSPIDPITGVATPLISSLTKNTLLPMQPCLAWDPVQPGVAGVIGLTSVPWALYNIPAALGGGLAYFDLYYGLNSFPPSYLVNSATGAPSPIALPLGWSLLLPPALKGLQFYVPLANALFSYQYGAPISSLLTAADIWGLTPLALLPPSVYL
jgi:hypothetical protein